MIQWPLNNGTNQHWTLTFADGYYTIQNGVSDFYLADASSAGETRLR
jgi:Ricin-type beta-trefoil lectin domain-like